MNVGVPNFGFPFRFGGGRGGDRSSRAVHGDADEDLSRSANHLYNNN